MGDFSGVLCYGFVQIIRIIELVRMDKSTLREQNYQIITKLHQGKIYIRLISDDPSLSDVWEAEIQSLNACAEILTNFFENLEDFYEHIQDKNNLRVDLRSGVISILLKTTIKNKQSYSEIARIKMSLCQKIDVKSMNLENILQICSNEQALSNNMIKNFFKILAQQVLVPIEESKIDEILNPFINKFRIIGEENENLQRKLGGVFSEIAELRQNNLKEVGAVTAEMHRSFEELKDYIETVKEGIDREIIRCENKYEVISFEFKQKIQRVIMEVKDEGLAITKMKQQIAAMDQQIYDLQRQLYQRGFENFKAIERFDNFIDMTQPFFYHFKIEDNIVTKKVPTRGYSTMLIGKHSFDKREKFSIKVETLNMYPIYIGAIDGKHKNQQYCEKTDNRVWISNEGVIFDGEKEKKTKYQFGINTTIQVSVNQARGEIVWSFKDVKIPVEIKLLKNKEIKWYPCIWMGDAGDSIELKKNE